MKRKPKKLFKPRPIPLLDEDEIPMASRVPIVPWAKDLDKDYPDMGMRDTILVSAVINGVKSG